MSNENWPEVVRMYARQAGHPDPDQFERQMRLESASYRDDVIYCRFVNHAGVLGIAQLHPSFHDSVLACDPHRALPYAAELMTRAIATKGVPIALIDYNWGIGNRTRNWDGTFKDLPGETQTYLSVVMGEEEARRALGESIPVATRVGPDVPQHVVQQSWDWDCFPSTVYSALWIREQLGQGKSPTYSQLIDLITKQGVVTQRNGLEIASGGPAAAFLRDNYGIEAYNIPSLSRQRVADEIRKGNLVAVGARQWGPSGHWALAVGVEDDGTIILENPAPGYMLGGTPIRDFIRDSWSKSEWSGVVIPVGVPAVVVPPASCEDRVKFLEAALQDKDRLIVELQTKLGEAANYDGSVRRGLKGIVDFLEAVATKKEPS